MQYDLFVIGAGSGGVRCARMAAQMGAKVAIAEPRWLGGTCVNVGCVPKKLYSYAAHFHEDFADAQGFGWRVGASDFHWPTLRDNKKQEISRLNGVYRNLLANAGVQLLEGKARFVDAHTVEVDEQHYSASHILIATGGWPVTLDIPGKELAITSNEIFDLDTLPEKMAVVGGGYIALEFASIMNGLGVETHVLYRGPLFLRGFDDEVRQFVAREMSKKGVHLHFECNVDSITERDGRKLLTLDSGKALQVDQVMFATGRRPNTAGLNLQASGVALNGDAIAVDDNYQTSVPHIYAVGDVIDRVALTPVALAEGMTVAYNLFGEGRAAPSYDNIASAVFTHPNIGTVGLTEEQAVERGHVIEVFTSEFRHLKSTLSGSEERVFMKLVVDKPSDKVLGCHMVGPDAGEIIQGMAIAMNCGATKADFDRTIGIHPTAAEEFVTMREAR